MFAMAAYIPAVVLVVVRQKRFCLLEGDDALFFGEDDAGGESHFLVREMSPDVLQSPAMHFFQGSDLKRQVGFGFFKP